MCVRLGLRSDTSIRRELFRIAKDPNHVCYESLKRRLKQLRPLKGGAE